MDLNYSCARFRLDDITLRGPARTVYIEKEHLLVDSIEACSNPHVIHSSYLFDMIDVSCEQSSKYRLHS